MIYEYWCESCKLAFDVVKSVKEYATNENCIACGNITRKIFSPPQLSNLYDRPEFNYGLGCVVKNKQHRKELAKQKGLVEVGNEKVDFTKYREEKRRKRWESV